MKQSMGIGIKFSSNNLRNSNTQDEKTQESLV